MRSYLSLIPISARAHRRRNRLTLSCITLAVFLVTAIFSLADMGMRMEGGRLLEKHGAEALRAFLDNPALLSYYLLAGALFLLVLLAGVLMISGSMNSDVARRVSFFGLLRCLGMSRRQVIRYVRLEALSWCATAVPLGLALGMLVTWALCAVLRFLVGEEFTGIPLFGVSLIGICFGVVTGVVTVLFASGSPARRAARTSPSAAMGGDTESVPVHGPVGPSGCGRVEIRLGLRHALAIKKSFLLTAGSFALSIILFLSFSVLIELVGYMMPQSSADAQFEIYGDGGNSIDPALKEALAGVPGVERVFGRRSLLDTTGSVAGQAESLDLIAFDDFDLDCLRRDKLLKKGADISEVYGDGGALAVCDGDAPLRLGDRVTLPGGELEIAGFLKYDPFSADGISHGRLTLIVSGERFRRLTGTDGYSLLMLQTERDISEESVAAIGSMAGAGSVLLDRRGQSTANTYTAFVFFVYAFLCLIALVTVLNIMNGISMSVSARMKRYGVMRAVGMSGRQMTRMIAAEAAACALSGCLMGCALGLPLSKWLYGALITDHFGFARWSFPAGPLAVILIFILLALVAAVCGPSRRIRDMEICETINSL